jgi:hypothetical protein
VVLHPSSSTNAPNIGSSMTFHFHFIPL